jgi:hypothetical protein
MAKINPNRPAQRPPVMRPTLSGTNKMAPTLTSAKGRPGIPVIKSIQGMINYVHFPAMSRNISSKMAKMGKSLQTNEKVIKSMTALTNLRSKITIPPNAGQVSWDKPNELNKLFEGTEGFGDPRGLKALIHNLRMQDKLPKELKDVLNNLSVDWTPETLRRVIVVLTTPKLETTIDLIGGGKLTVRSPPDVNVIGAITQLFNSELGKLAYLKFLPSVQVGDDLGNQLLTIKKELEKLLREELTPGSRLHNDVKSAVDRIQDFYDKIDVKTGRMINGPNADVLRQSFFSLWVLDDTQQTPVHFHTANTMGRGDPIKFEARTALKNNSLNGINDTNSTAAMLNEGGKMELKQDMFTMEQCLKIWSSVSKMIHDVMTKMAQATSGR